MYENLKWISHAFCDCEKKPKTNYGNEPNDGCKCHVKTTMWRERKREKKCNSATKQQLRLDACNSREKSK